MIGYGIALIVAVIVLFFLFRRIILWILEKFLPPEYTEPSVEEKLEEKRQLLSKLRNLDQEVEITEELVDIDAELVVLRERLEKAENKRSNKGD